VINNKEPMYGCNGRLGLACIEIIEAMYKSNATGKAVRGRWG
jgi:predicted dehydrogenase